MSWNYRVFKRVFNTTGEDEEIFTIHEAYYDKGKKRPHSISKDAMYPCGSTLDELKSDLELFRKAFEKPVLDYETFEEVSPD